jgi:hypothetical protein
VGSATSSPLKSKLVNKTGFGKVLVRRGAVDQKRPFRAAFYAIRGAGKRLPVNLTR